MVDLPSIPFVTDARIVALPTVAARGGIVVTWQADLGRGPRTIARTITGADEIEALAHALLAVAAAARHQRDGGVAVDQHKPAAATVQMMRSVSLSPRCGVTTTPPQFQHRGERA